MPAEHKNKITTEQEFFLSTLADFINERPGKRCPTDVDVDSLVALSDRQQMSPVLYYQTLMQNFQRQYAGNVYSSINRAKLLDEIDGRFKAANVSYIIFKGPEAARYYPHNNLRTFGDIDILVKAADKERAGEILEGAGFSSDGIKRDDHEWSYSRPGLELELHHRLLYNDSMNEDRIMSFTDSVWDHASTENVICYHLEPEFHFVFMFLHLRKHFLWAGIGIRQFVDIACMARNAGLDWDKVGSYIRICGAEKFASVCFALIKRWFGVSIPVLAGEITDDFYCSATDTVLSGSPFGDTSRDNIYDNSIFNKTKKRGKLKSVLAILFPPFEQMKKRYPILGRYKILLPLMWIRRMISSLFKKNAGNGLRFAAKHLESNEARSNELRQWGLE